MTGVETLCEEGVEGPPGTILHIGASGLTWNLAIFPSLFLLIILRLPKKQIIAKDMTDSIKKND